MASDLARSLVEPDGQRLQKRSDFNPDLSRNWAKMVPSSPNCAGLIILCGTMLGFLSRYGAGQVACGLSTLTRLGALSNLLAVLF